MNVQRRYHAQLRAVLRIIHTICVSRYLYYVLNACNSAQPTTGPLQADKNVGMR